MAYIKKLVMRGFKSFVRKTELPFTPGINVILGPNGSGKSNVSDGLCFVLGRLSIKSMRAAKAKNLIFLGSKIASPAKEAIVEIVFDNSKNTFSIDKDEIAIKRIVRRNGQSIYKINNETKTRQEVLTLLAQAGIDPNGFNIILQGEIQNFVRMMPEERRKIIEEVSGISIYELRKEKSLKELNKTEEKLKEVLAILRERTSYLNNLEKERQEALKYKKLEEDKKKFKASILNHDFSRKKKESENVKIEIQKKNKEIEKIKKDILEFQVQIEKSEMQIDSINKIIKEKTGFEQERLNHEIANLRADIAGFTVRLENYEKRNSELKRKKAELEEIIRESELLVKDLQKEPFKQSGSRKEKELSSKKKELEEIEEQRKKYYMSKSEMKSLRDLVDDKKSTFKSFSTESNILLKQIDSLSLELFDIKSSSEKLDFLKRRLSEKKSLIDDLNKKEIELEKKTHTNEYEIEKQNKIIENISRLDVCPLCKSKVTPEHLKNIKNEIKPQVESLKSQIEKADKELNEIYSNRDILKSDIEQIADEISKRESDLIKISSINEKKEQLKSLQNKLNLSKEELDKLEKRLKNLERGFDENSNIEQKYETLKIELQEVSLRSAETVDTEVSFKQREVERSKIALKQIIREETDLLEDMSSVKEELEKKEEMLDNKRKQEEELSKRFQKMIQERDDLQKRIRELESNLSLERNKVYNTEQESNNLKIDLAKVNAEIENLETEMLAFPNIELVGGSKEVLSDKLARTEEILSRIGSVNLRSLEVYDAVKKEYESVQERVDIIEKEKQSIMKIIHEIDVKKKKSFTKTFDSLNEIFARNFSQLSTKGQVTLELENKKDPFEGGVGIVVKTGHGKYFDVKSLSGGEQALVALSLIFAIQELKPYSFYILDEIDAALDKKNSERLAGLLKKYMRQGQYIVITHNDEVISNATNLYGVSMHDGVSKVVSLKV